VGSLLEEFAYGDPLEATFSALEKVGAKRSVQVLNPLGKTPSKVLLTRQSWKFQRTQRIMIQVALITLVA
jgi:hypothetical protein